SAAHPTWMAAAGNWQVLEGGPGVARVKQRTTGVYAGSEHALGAGLRLGGVLGLTRSTARFDDLYAKGHVNSYSLALYGARTVAAGAGDFNAVAGAAYTWHDMDTRRHFHWAGTSQTLTADTHGSTFQAFGELGYRWRASARVQIEPFAALAWRDVRTRAFVESGGWAAISAGPSRLTQTTTTLGVRG
ncbi:autotransporter outer membrane beta-barrel domain-containing protein, partial [Bordetella pertussis]